MFGTLSTLALMAGTSVGDAVDSTYLNARFGFSICYPAALLAPQGEADNGDGQTFTSLDGAMLRAYGRYDVENEGLAAASNATARLLAGGAGHITYRVQRKDWAVLSGDNGKGMVFYAKLIRQDDRILQFHLIYPATQATRFNPVAARLSRCLKTAR